MSNMSDASVTRVMSWMAGGLLAFLVLMIFLARFIVY